MNALLGMNTLLARLKRQALETPELILVQTTGQSRTAAQLWTAIEHVADRLRVENIQRVALLADNGPDWIVVDLACQLADISLLPLPTFFSSAQIWHALQQVQVQCLITDRLLGSTSLLADNEQPLQRAEGLLSLHALFLEPLSPSVADSNPLPCGTGKITFTSGSTGQPKGVCLANSALMATATAIASVIPVSAARHLSILPLSTLLENVCGVYSCLLTGGTSIVLPPGELGLVGSSGLDVQRCLAQINHWQPNTLVLVPELLKALVIACEKGWQAPDSLQFVAVGGGHVAPDLLRRARKNGLPVYEGYGLSECGSVVSVNRPAADQCGSVGKPLPHLQVAIKNGEIWVSGSSQLGYLGDPDSWYPERIATGDLGRIDSEGFLIIQGRKKNLLISSFGRNINPEWVESVFRADSRVQHCVVFGEARPYLTALIESPMTPNGLSELIASINSQLPDYAQIKRWQRFDNALLNIPGLLTENGRYRRQAIYQYYQPTLEALYEASATEVSA